ncbi:hypothetical protein AV530_006126 [Patagioenas fasciata monilis]|uniref:Uncharacterized protein n=1 Tax=Patagioenas fasciata monilis TaxID=372326 RepID=A0A1V4J8D3_PATFA|nr:hypothetical protein AV530_006126 [Patagioenas fasciata monilis]
MSASSKMDPPLGKDQPISDIFEQKEKKTIHLQLERGERICERNNSSGIKVSEEGGGGDALTTKTAIPLLVVKIHGEGGCPSVITEVHSGADIHLQPMEDPMVEQVGAPEGGYDPMGSLC